MTEFRIFYEFVNIGYSIENIQSLEDYSLTTHIRGQNPAALFLHHMATFTTGGSDIGQLFFQHPAGLFQPLVLSFDFPVTADTHFVIGSLVIVD